MTGFIDRIVQPGTIERPVDQLHADLLRATEVMGDLPASTASMDEGAVRFWASQRWNAVATRYDRVGNVQAARECRARAQYLTP
jgi:hypothetical protein